MTVQADTRFRRLPERGSKDFGMACAIVDEAKICHVGFTLDDQPYVIPMAVARDGDKLLLHGSRVSRIMQALAGGLPCCVTVTHLDGLVLARSAFNSSMNYRSLMVFGQALEIGDGVEKRRVLDRLVDHLIPGRSTELRPSTQKELDATMLLALPIETFSIKTRSGPPGDAAADLDSPAWAGVIPLKLAAGEPIDAPDLTGGWKPGDYFPD
ncbi:MAG: pyridoxamine 5'-phosphate oxidase family protein [Xanthomonadales bacterium]|jgi:nitroimidazol reductase NimA-like FMN-containing flavoprotein (pyridoxamine 5'-phosphate oxidase superfamily)|nr:pyridoxamine 5'-phosphate oxidase family protein [Xanthomonadales bacterium]